LCCAVGYSSRSENFFCSLHAFPAVASFSVCIAQSPSAGVRSSSATVFHLDFCFPRCRISASVSVLLPSRRFSSVAPFSLGFCAAHASSLLLARQICAKGSFLAVRFSFGRSSPRVKGRRCFGFRCRSSFVPKDSISCLHGIRVLSRPGFGVEW
jgi:hypothetical protein